MGCAVWPLIKLGEAHILWSREMYVTGNETVCLGLADFGEVGATWFARLFVRPAESPMISLGKSAGWS